MSRNGTPDCCSSNTAADGWPGYWGMEGPEYLAWIGEDAEPEHIVLMGATTYRLMSGFCRRDARRAVLDGPPGAGD